VSRKRKNAAALSGPESPQKYEHRVECTIRALEHVLLGWQSLIRFLLAKQSPEAPRYDALDNTSGNWRRARRWLKNARPVSPTSQKDQKAFLIHSLS
jgi:hypothetical protein